MIEIQLHSWYDHFTLTQQPKYIKWVEYKRPIEFYSDTFVYQNNNPNASALLIEPRSIQPDVYQYMEKNWQKFRYIFTHDSELLKLPNAKRILFGGVYEFNDVPKTKGISFCSSNKAMCELHRKRMRLARELEGVVDCMGTYNGGKKVSTYDIHAPYRFSVIIENYIDDYWFTEKICNCFANKCVPIYYGARKIDEFFNASGIIRAKSIEDMRSWIHKIQYWINLEVWYNNMMPVINENYELVKQYTCFEDWFYNEYKELLNGYNTYM